MTTEKKTINLTPKWIEILPLLLKLVRDGNAHQEHTAIQELEKMAQAADKWNESVDEEIICLNCGKSV